MKEEFIERLYSKAIKFIKKIKIKYSDSKNVKILKLCYLLPFVVILYPFLVIILGVIEMGNPFCGIKDIFDE